MISDNLYDRPALEKGMNNSLSKLLEYIPNKGKLLDVGCATGELGAFLSSYTDLEIDAIEAHPESAEVAEQHYQNVWQIDLETKGFSKQLEKNYDVIVIADVLEHLRTPEATVIELLDCLTTDGKLLVSIPNVAHAAVILQLLQQKFTYLNHGLLDKTHVRFFSPQSIPNFMQLLGNVGWKLLDRVEIGVQGTEFAEELKNGISGQWVQMLSRLPEANTYQFLLEIKPSKAYSPDAQFINSLHEVSDLGIFIQPTVFFQKKGEESFSGKDSQSIRCYLTEYMDFDFELPNDVQKIRFDPADIPGLVTIKRLMLLDKNQQILWQFCESAPILNCSSDITFQWNNSDLNIFMTSFDPWFEVPVEQEVIEQAVTLKVQMNWPMTHDFQLLKQHKSIEHQNWFDQVDSLNGQLSACQLALNEEKNNFLELQESYQNTLNELKCLRKKAYFGFCQQAFSKLARFFKNK
ncbi:class I SAM-dependent methyltransferase [Thiomicrorhabdus indica]|uniref:class I SAM-dependent methyltransferase n=1 Tax=Thiomicrorhabdus indica TaxID=2267253 RepID=UPI00102D732E|nr:class I SAM-dependent methyltransferase [Thiomicrorhabdus indica]